LAGRTAFFALLLATVVHGRRGEERDVFAAFLYGTVLHYVLDRTIHPYVYGRTGRDENGRLTLRETAGFVDLLAELWRPKTSPIHQAVPAWETLLRGVNHDGSDPVSS
jgi:hypothetical protein